MLRPSLVCLALALGFGSACAHQRPAASPSTAETADPPNPPDAESPAASTESDTPTVGVESDSATAPTAPASSPPADTRGKEQIQQVIADNRHKVRACYDAALANNPGIQGDLVISFVINPEGDVKEAEVNWAESEIHIPELDTCAADSIKALKFPASSRGLESKVNYPFNFNPSPPQPRSKKPAVTPSGVR